MPYRVELAKQGRAGCKNKECLDAGVKINKGEFRMGTLITIHEHTSWTWKHWGCVTPLQVNNLIEESGGDTEMVDGYDELPPEYQEKVQFALANGHVPDEDWKGDVECNRPGQKGFRVKTKTPKKKQGTKADEDADEEEPKPKKKRGRPAKEDNDEEAPAPKKGRGKKGAAKKDEEVVESEVEAPKPKKAARGKKPVYKEESESEVDAPKPKVKKAAKGKKAAIKDDPSEDEDAEEAEAPKPKRGRKKAVAADDEEKPAPQKRGRKKKAAAETE